MLASRPPSPGQPAAHRSPVTLSDLLDDLLWPHLLRSWKLALAPGRVALCFLLVVVIGGLWKLSRLGSGGDVLGDLFHDVHNDLLSITHIFAGPPAAALAFYHLFVEIPWQLVREHPVIALVYLPVILMVWCGVGGAVCRSCACEVSLRAALPWRQAVGFGFKKSLALFAALAGPLVMVWGACLFLKMLGLALFTSKVMGLLGGLTFIGPLLLCVVIAIALAAYVLAHSLLIPAVACEGTDSFDAVQRCYAYTLARPGRLVGYMVISFFATLPAVVVVAVIGFVAVLTAASLTGAPVGPFDWMNNQSLSNQTDAYFPLTKHLVNLWTLLVVAVGFAYFVSLYFCASTNLYLVIRRLVDGQDIAELWTPPVVSEIPAIKPAAVPPPIPEKADYT